MEMVVEQIDAEPPQRLVLREADEASTFDVEYRLEATGTGTCFTQISEFEWKRLPRFLHGTFGRGVRRDIRNQLRALKQLLEG
jgi:phosphoribosylaminoimidazole-succinocarboxamide synthase